MKRSFVAVRWQQIALTGQSWAINQVADAALSYIQNIKRLQHTCTSQWTIHLDRPVGRHSSVASHNWTQALLLGSIFSPSSPCFSWTFSVFV